MRPMSCAAVVLIVLVGCGERPNEQPPRVELGRPAPRLSVERILQPASGATATWEALRGKVVVLEFWATWCGPCVGAIAHLNELADTFKDRPVQFIAVTDETEAAVGRFLTRKPMRAWVGLDTDRSMFQDYRVTGIPRTILVDAKGVVVGDTHPTALSVAALENVLAGRPPSLPELSREAEAVVATSSADDEDNPPLVEVSIRRRDVAEGHLWSCDSSGWEFSGCALRTIVEAAYAVQPHQILLPEELGDTRFDAKAKMAAGREAVRPLLQSALMSALRLTPRLETRHQDGYRLVAPAERAHKLTPTAMEAGAGTHSGHATDAAGMVNYTLVNETVTTLCAVLGRLLDCPVRDETHLEGRFDVLLEWKDGVRNDLLRAVQEQLGLELQPATHSVEMLIFEARADEQSAAPPPATGGVSTSPVEFRSPAQVVIEALRPEALVAVVRRASDDERSAALRGFGDEQGGGVSRAGSHFILNQCVAILAVEEWLTGAADLPKTIFLSGACGGRSFTKREIRTGEEAVEDLYRVESYPNFVAPDRRWLVFCRPAALSDFNNESAEHFKALLGNQTFRLDPPNVFILADRLAGFVISDDPASVEQDEWRVPGAFVSDLKAILLSCGVAVQSDLAREVLSLRETEQRPDSLGNPTRAP